MRTELRQCGTHKLYLRLTFLYIDLHDAEQCVLLGGELLARKYCHNREMLIMKLGRRLYMSWSIEMDLSNS